MQRIGDEKIEREMVVPSDKILALLSKLEEELKHRINSPKHLNECLCYVLASCLVTEVEYSSKLEESIEKLKS
jgi:hypothetical protein